MFCEIFVHIHLFTSSYSRVFTGVFFGEHRVYFSFYEANGILI